MCVKWPKRVILPNIKRSITFKDCNTGLFLYFNAYSSCSASLFHRTRTWKNKHVHLTYLEKAKRVKVLFLKQYLFCLLRCTSLAPHLKKVSTTYFQIVNENKVYPEAKDADTTFRICILYPKIWVVVSFHIWYIWHFTMVTPVWLLWIMFSNKV